MNTVGQVTLLKLEFEPRLTCAFELAAGVQRRIAELAAESSTAWRELIIGGADSIANITVFEPFGWRIFVTEERNTFYEAINQIIYRESLQGREPVRI